MNAQAEYNEPYVTIEVITPNRAKEMLESMGNNRHISGREVGRLAKDMENGFFTLSNDAICIDEDGHLMNGQHRLSACIKANKPITTLVLYNLPRNTVIDIQRKRSVSDLLTFGSNLPYEETTKDCTSTVRAYFICKPVGQSRKELSPFEFEQFISEYGESIVTAIHICRKGNNRPIMKKAGCYAAVFAALECGVNEEKLYRFAKAVNSGFTDFLDENAAIILRNKLEEIKTGGQVQLKQIAAYTERAIFEFMKGNTAKYWKKKDIDKHIYIDACDATV